MTHTHKKRKCFANFCIKFIYLIKTIIDRINPYSAKGNTPNNSLLSRRSHLKFKRPANT